MTPGQQILAFTISPIVTLIVVLLGVLFSNRHVDVRISDLQRAMDQRFTDTVARLEALIRAETAELRREMTELRAEIAELRNRIERLEGERRVIR